jgi:hypothetical protein
MQILFGESDSRSKTTSMVVVVYKQSASLWAGYVPRSCLPATLLHITTFPDCTTTFSGIANGKPSTTMPPKQK